MDSVTRADRIIIPPCFRVGGTKISAVNCRAAVDRFYDLVEAKQGGYVTVTSAHGVVEAQTDRRLMGIIERADLTLPDGMPIFWAGRVTYGKRVGRVPGAEFFSAVFADPRANGLRHFFYGSQEATACAVVARVISKIGENAVAGWHCPPMRAVGAPEDEVVLARMRALQPDVVWVGLSTPKQEYWMANHQQLLPNAILVGVGAAFDFYAGIKERGPRVIRESGFEWLYRLTKEPQRLWPRYRTVVPRMLSILACDAARAAFRSNVTNHDHNA